MSYHIQIRYCIYYFKILATFFFLEKCLFGFNISEETYIGYSVSNTQNNRSVTQFTSYVLSIHAIVLSKCVNTQWFPYPAEKHLGSTPGNVSYTAIEGYPLQNSCYNLNGRTINDSIEITFENAKGNEHRINYNIRGSNSQHTRIFRIEDFCVSPYNHSTVYNSYFKRLKTLFIKIDLLWFEKNFLHHFWYKFTKHIQLYLI